MPVAVVWGESDRILPVPDGVRLHRVPAGHMLHMEAAGPVLDRLKAVLTG